MSDTSLQKFDYRSSPYARPNADWECGRLREGKPCSRGPDKKGHCQTRTECKPGKAGDRWHCTRLELDGGLCEDGPNPDGSCCRTILFCSPVRSLRSKRRFLSSWVFAVCIGAAVLMLSGSDMSGFVSPGKLSTKHADLDGCQTCHSQFEHGLAHWVKAVMTLDAGIDDSKLCLSCHVLNDNPQLPHNLSISKLKEMSGTAATASQPELLPQLKLASFLYPERQEQHEGLTCSTCHREHHDDDIRLTELSNENCLICHQAKFDNFAGGHPEFSNFPYARRTNINFDHVSHLGKHFKEEKYQSLTTGSCIQCHEPDPRGRKMLVNAFDVTCSGCHRTQILGETRSGSKGIPVFAVPGLDVETLKERGFIIGDWPEFADEPLSPFIELFLSSDNKFGDAWQQLKNIDLLDLSEASDRQMQSAVELAWSVKRLFYDLLKHGTPELKQRLDSVSKQPLQDVAIKSLVAMLPEDAVRMAQQTWFPRLLEEMEHYQSGNLSSLKTMQNIAPIKTATAPITKQKDISQSSDDDDLLGDELGNDDDLFGDSDDLFGEEDGEDLFGDDDDEKESDKKPVQLSAENWAAFGGWFRGQYALRYAPTGHSDTFIKSWMEYLSSSDEDTQQQLFQTLVNNEAVGACGKCHSVDKSNGPGVTVNWRSIGAASDPLTFTKYSHTTHFNLTDDRGCVQCHVMDKEANYQASFEHDDPHDFTSNFKPIERQFCASCHQKQIAGDTCLQCHNYHITEILSGLMAQGTEPAKLQLKE